MTRSFKGFFIFLIPSLFLGLLACDKDKTTTINGVIVDAKTGLPLTGVVINFGLYAANEQRGSYQLKSDVNGKVSFSLAHDEAFSGFEMLKTGYVPKFQLGTTYTNGIENDIVIVMHPRDAILRLIYENTSGQEKLIYMQAQSPTFSAEYGLLPYLITQPYPYICQPNKRDTVDYLFTSDERIDVFWGFNYYEKVSQAPFNDTLSLSRGDTAIFIINF